MIAQGRTPNGAEHLGVNSAPCEGRRKPAFVFQG